MSGEEEDEIRSDMMKLEKVNAIVSKAGFCIGMDIINGLVLS